jgi:hypothetical protein
MFVFILFIWLKEIKLTEKPIFLSTLPATRPLKACRFTSLHEINLYHAVINFLGQYYCLKTTDVV